MATQFLSIPSRVINHKNYKIFIQCKYSVLFFGSDNFSIPSLKMLLRLKTHFAENGPLISNLAAITSEDKHAGRNKKSLVISPVKTFSTQNGIEVFQLKDVLNLEKSFVFDLAIAVSYGKFIPKRLLKRFAFGGINVHPSSLPKYRGAAPIFHALWNEDKYSGVTIQTLSDETFDKGMILNHKQVSIGNLDYQEAHLKFSEIGAALLRKTLLNLESYKTKAKKQDEKDVTFAPKMTKDLAEIKWNADSAKQIEKKIKFISWKYPLFTKYENSRIQLFGLKTIAIDNIHNRGIFIPANSVFTNLAHTNPTLETKAPPSLLESPGTIYFSKDKRRMLCATLTKDIFLEVQSVKLENRSLISVYDFWNGYAASRDKKVSCTN